MSLNKHCMKVGSKLTNENSNHSNQTIFQFVTFSRNFKKVFNNLFSASRSFSYITVNALLIKSYT